MPVSKPSQMEYVDGGLFFGATHCVCSLLSVQILLLHCTNVSFFRNWRPQPALWLRHSVLQYLQRFCIIIFGACASRMRASGFCAMPAPPPPQATAGSDGASATFNPFISRSKTTYKLFRCASLKSKFFIVFVFNMMLCTYAPMPIYGLTWSAQWRTVVDATAAASGKTHYVECILIWDS